MKILILSPLYYPERFGGIEKVVYELTKRLKSESLDIVVVCGTHAYQESSIEDDIRVHRIPTVGAFNEASFDRYYSANSKALEIITQENPDLIWAHDWFFAMAALNYQEHNNVKLISQAHILKRVESRQRISSWRSFVDIMQSLLFRSSHAVLAASKSQIRELVLQYRIPKSKVHHVRYGLDAPTSLQKNKKYSVPTFLYLGRFEAEKNIEVLLDTLLTYESQLKSPIQLFLVGSGSLQRNLENKALQLKQVQVKFKPFSSNSDHIRQIISEADALILPSNYDSYGLSALEAISLATPVLVSRQCGIAEDLIHYPQSLIFDSRNRNEIFKAIQFSVANLEELPELGLVTRKQMASTHDWDLTVQQILASIGLRKKEFSYV